MIGSQKTNNFFSPALDICHPFFIRSSSKPFQSSATWEPQLPADNDNIVSSPTIAAHFTPLVVMVNLHATLFSPRDMWAAATNQSNAWNIIF